MPSRCDEPDDLKREHAALLKGKQDLKAITDIMKSDYITNFCGILGKGVDTLEKETQDKLKNETDPAKRHEIITWATKAYARMSKFIQEIIDNLPPPTPAPFTDE
ncbi:unnamed protein product [Medioppia subpectinata]|uniref:Uncharacterized protein n=1 Tax=Medioppia subpectinata TaxID=1979941 RepID=A0A7R9Q2M5_9ACAR|nr:unnamed protein product [Medioppia subpectinata]CAG2110427.1 unnamed protein product [Medioppia subpectinata]